MRVIQLLTTISYGDAVGNDVLALHKALFENGYQTAIYAENIDPRLPRKWVNLVEDMPALKEDDIILYHLSTGTKLNYKLPEYKGRKILIYHNITPENFFKNYNMTSYELCEEGRKGLKYLADKVDYCLADSEYNKQDLLSAGYRCAIDVLPILIPFDDYRKQPDRSVIETYRSNDCVNIVFTGRIAPNKKQEDVISAFYMYQKYYNQNARLFLVGSRNGMEKYDGRLREYVKALELKNVFFTGHVKFPEILAYYSIADLFICMSEHEGFCVPLVEAMFFDIPIIAYNSTAIADTLGGTGIMLEDKLPLETAGMMDYILQHSDIKEQVVRNQRERLKDFSHDKIEKQFLNYLNVFLERTQ